MDGRGRLAQPLKRSAKSRAGKARGQGSAKFAWLPRVAAAVRPPLVVYAAAVDRLATRMGARVHALKPRYFGISACGLLVLAAAAYGVVRGDHVPTILATLKNAADEAANAAGFRITSLNVAGRRQLKEAEILSAAGIGERTSLLLLDVEAARTRLEAQPWIAQATVRKLYPGRLEITVEERNAFALWQQAGKLYVIAADGTVLEPLGERGAAALPLVVGPGAAQGARAFLQIVDRYPAIRAEMRAAVLVAERRWNLKLKSGLDVRLPETEVARALDRLTALDREKQLLSRDITSVDLRLPDRVSVRLSDEAAQAREQAAKERERKKKKGGDA